MKTTLHIFLITLFFLPLNSAISQSDKLPTSQSKMPTGTSGVDYNLLDSRGEKDGVWIRVWPSGVLYYIGEFDSGKPVGQFYYFFDSGELMSSIDHFETEISAIHYRPNGSVQASGYYNPSPIGVEPTKRGSWWYYDDNSVLRILENYNNGVMHGEYQVWDYKSQLVEKGEYNQGGKTGEWTKYFENGRLSQKVTYLNGDLDGVFEIYHLNGLIRMTGQYFKGREEGEWKSFYEDGKMEMITKYSFGENIKEIRINGVFEETFMDGRSMNEYTYKDMVLDGPYRIWHDCGEYIIDVFTDQKTGEEMQRRVLEGTQVKEEGEYYNGVLDGPRYFYDLQGKLIKKEVYENGVLVD